VYTGADVTSCHQYLVLLLLQAGLAAAAFGHGPAPAVPPAAAHPAATDSVAGSALPETSLAAALAAAGSLTPEQHAILQDALEEQLEAAAAADSESDSESDSSSDDGVCVSAAADEGTAVRAADEGTAVHADSTLESECGKASAAAKYMDKLDQPLWQCNGQTCTLLLCQAIFMLMAWKIDYCVRDAAFAALLGMLSELLLPQVSPRPGTLPRGPTAYAAAVALGVPT